jgi:hypothetical protein
VIILLSLIVSNLLSSATIIAFQFRITEWYGCDLHSSTRVGYWHGSTRVGYWQKQVSALAGLGLINSAVTSTRPLPYLTTVQADRQMKYMVVPATLQLTLSATPAVFGILILLYLQWFWKISVNTKQETADVPFSSELLLFLHIPRRLNTNSGPTSSYFVSYKTYCNTFRKGHKLQIIWKSFNERYQSAWTYENWSGEKLSIGMTCNVMIYVGQILLIM